MGAEQGAEGSELKPSQIELSSEVFCRDEASDVGSPKWNAGERCIDRNRNLCLERLPFGIHVPRPKKRCVPLHAGIAVTVQRIGTLVRSIELGTLPVHTVAG